MDTEGIRLAGLYSLGCPELKQDDGDAEKKVETFVRGLRVRGSFLPLDIRGILENLDPFLFYQLIALASNVSDFFDANVVRAHWLGGPLLKTVEKSHIEQVFRNGKSRLPRDTHHLVNMALKLRALMGKPPHHNICVVSILGGFNLNGCPIPEILQKINECLVRAGKVVGAGEETLMVESFVVGVAGIGVIGLKEECFDIRRGFAENAQVDDYVSFHLGRGREIISAAQADLLRIYTQEAIQFAKRGK